MFIAHKRSPSLIPALVLGAAAITACERGADTSGPPDGFEPMEIWWETSIPDFSANPDRPLITLNGNNAISLNIGDAYVDAGATATDPQDGDVTAQIVVDNPVDTRIAADFLVRYSVSDSSGTDAIEAVRIVRVVDGTPNQLTQRWVGSTASHLGYVEHLPATYTDNPGQTFPLLIWNHGGNANAATFGEAGFTAIQAIGGVIGNGGPSLIINGGNWNPADPFIVLSPQTVNLNFGDPVERLDAFIDYAETVYNIDPDRIYVSGWSAGAALSLAHAVLHSDRVAAVVPIANGLPLTETIVLPDGYCDIENVPVWQFHGEVDDVISVQGSVDNHNLIINNCTSLVTPRLTIYLGEDHDVHHGTWNLTMMEGGNLGVSSDPTYDRYDQSLFDWLQSHSLQNRGQ